MASIVSLGRTLRFMLAHPIGRLDRMGTLTRFLRWQLGSRILGAPAAMPFIGESRLLVKTGMRGATMNLYVGLQEFEDMAFVLHFLRAGDCFADVGANVGVYTVLAASRGAQVVAFEPVATTFQELQDNIHLNRYGDHAIALNIALAATKGFVQMSCDSGPKNHVVSKSDPTISRSTTVPVDTFDDAIGQRLPQLIKIDVEGFEHEVLKGAQRSLENPALLALVIELNGLGSRYGCNDADADRVIRAHGFQPARYQPFTRDLQLVDLHNPTGNTLYVRYSDELLQRLRSAPAFVSVGRKI